MGIKIYKRIGLRRDKNLGDLSDPVSSLNNLLDDVGSGGSFVSEDLDPIRGAAALGLTPQGYQQFIGSAQQSTSSTGTISDFFPRITFQNRLDRLEVFAGEPRLNGGNGLTAKYYNKNQVFTNTANIFSGLPFKTDNFWEAGNFSYSGKITPEAVDVNGGVEWEGYFIPTVTGQHIFYVSTTALTTFEFETEGYVSGIGTYTEQSRVGITSTFAATGSINTNTITLSSAANTNYVAIGQSVTTSGIVAGTVVETYNRSNGVITLTPPSGTTYALSSNVNGNVTFSKAIGQSTQIYYITYTLEKFRKYHVRFRYYIPQNIDAINASRSIDFNLIRPGGSTTEDLRFTNLYALDYDFSNDSKGDFVVFLDNSLSFGGGTCGGTSSSNDYVKIQTSKKVDIRYQPKSSITNITKLNINGTTTNNSSIVNLSSTSGLELGNYVFGTNISDGTIIKEIVVNNSVILSTNATGSGTVNLTFIDHRGFVKRAVGSGSGGSFSLSSGNTTNLKSGMIMIGSGVESYTGITTTGSASAFTISPSQTIPNTNVYFYQSRGLINNALDPFCPVTLNKCVVVTVAAGIGSTIIQVNNTTGISNGWKVQGFQFASGTTVTGKTATTISLSTGIINSLIVGGNFTVTNDSGDKTLCCPPTDTSPPFNPTFEGLETVVAAKNLRINSGNIKFDALKVGIANTITAYSSSNTSGSRLSIQTPSGTFKILCV